MFIKPQQAAVIPSGMEVSAFLVNPDTGRFRTAESPETLLTQRTELCKEFPDADLSGGMALSLKEHTRGNCALSCHMRTTYTLVELTKMAAVFREDRRLWGAIRHSDGKARAFSFAPTRPIGESFQKKLEGSKVAGIRNAAASPTSGYQRLPVHRRADGGGIFSQELLPTGKNVYGPVTETAPPEKIVFNGGSFHIYSFQDMEHHPVFGRVMKALNFLTLTEKDAPLLTYWLDLTVLSVIRALPIEGLDEAIAVAGGPGGYCWKKLSSKFAPLARYEYLPLTSVWCRDAYLSAIIMGQLSLAMHLFQDREMVVKILDAAGGPDKIRAACESHEAALEMLDEVISLGVLAADADPYVRYATDALGTRLSTTSLYYTAAHSGEKFSSICPDIAETQDSGCQVGESKLLRRITGSKELSAIYKKQMAYLNEAVNPRKGK